MNLAICSAGELFGGVERQIMDLCRFQVSSTGTAPVVVLFFDRELADRLRQEGIDPVILRGRNRYDPRMVDSLVDLILEREIDVVHAHGYKATIACALAKRKVQFGLVKTEHGMVEASPRKPISWLKSRLNFSFEQILTRKYVDTVCYVTDDINNFFKSFHRGINRRTVHNGIEPLSRNNFQRPEDLPVDEINLGIVGRVSEVKGIPIAIKAMNQLRVPGKVRLNIIGTGKLVSVLKAVVAETPMAESVHFLGFRRNIYDYLAHLDVLLMPSYHEGLPYTLLEGMSLGRPIVATRVGGLQEVIRDGHNGLLCPVGEAAPLAACLSRVLTDTTLGHELGRNARSDQTRFYTLETMGTKYSEVYGQINPHRENGGRVGG